MFPIINFLKERRQIVIAILVIAILFIGYSYFKNSNGNGDTLIVHAAKFTQQVKVSGKVVAADNVDMSFDQSGRVAGVYAKVGDTISKGATLASIENGDLRADLLQKQATLQSEQAKLASLRSGTRPEEIAVSQSSVDSAVAAADQAKRAVVNSILDAYTKADDAVRAKVDQFMVNPKSNNPQLNFQTSNSQLASNIGSERLNAEGAMVAWQTTDNNLDPKDDLKTIEDIALKNLSAVVTLLNDAATALNSTSASQSLSQATLDGYKSDIAAARTNVNTATTALTSAITAERAASTALVTAQNNLKLSQAGSTQNDIDVQAAKVKAAEADVLNAQSKLNKTIITAPFSGIVTKMDAKVGQIASPNTPLVSMISDHIFQIETYVPEVSISLVSVGNNADVTLDAYAGVAFKASVISIDPAETIKDGVSTYKTKLQFADDDPRIRSGMTADVTINTMQRDNTIVIPAGAVYSRDGASYVEVTSGVSAGERQVTVGATGSLGQVEILSGLAEGEAITLNPSKN